MFTKKSYFIRRISDLIFFIDILSSGENLKLKHFIEKEYPALIPLFPSFIEILGYIRWIFLNIIKLETWNNLNEEMRDNLLTLNKNSNYVELHNVVHKIFSQSYLNYIIKSDKKEQIFESISLLILIFQNYETNPKLKK